MEILSQKSFAVKLITVEESNLFSLSNIRKMIRTLIQNMVHPQSDVSSDKGMLYNNFEAKYCLENGLYMKNHHRSMVSIKRNSVLDSLDNSGDIVNQSKQKKEPVNELKSMRNFQKSYFDDLPVDIYEMIFDHLDPVSLARASRCVCKSIRSFSNTHPSLGKSWVKFLRNNDNLYKRYFRMLEFGVAHQMYFSKYSQVLLDHENVPSYASQIHKNVGKASNSHSSLMYGDYVEEYLHKLQSDYQSFILQREIRYLMYRYTHMLKNDGIIGLIVDLGWFEDERIASAISIDRYWALNTIAVEQSRVITSFKKICLDPHVKGLAKDVVNNLKLSSNYRSANVTPISSNSSMMTENPIQNTEETYFAMLKAQAAVSRFSYLPLNAPYDNDYDDLPFTENITGCLGYAVHMIKLEPHLECLRRTIFYTLFKNLLVFDTTDNMEKYKQIYLEQQLFLNGAHELQYTARQIYDKRFRALALDESRFNNRTTPYICFSYSGPREWMKSECIEGHVMHQNNINDGIRALFHFSFFPIGNHISDTKTYFTARNSRAVLHPKNIEKYCNTKINSLKSSLAYIRYMN